MHLYNVKHMTRIWTTLFVPHWRIWIKQHTKPKMQLIPYTPACEPWHFIKSWCWKHASYYFGSLSAFSC